MNAILTAPDIKPIFSTAEENIKLRKRIKELEDSIAVDDLCIEVNRGKVVFTGGNDGGGNTARLPAGEIPEAANTNTRRA